MSGMDDVAQGWLQHRIALHEMLELVDEEHLNFQPFAGAWTISELAIHTVTSMDRYVNAIKKGAFHDQATVNDYATMDDVRKIVHNYTEKTKEEIKTIFDFQLKTNIEFEKIKAPGTYWLSNAIDHEIHYKGQLYTYIQLTGVKDMPPFMKLPFEV